jgi:glycolate oxidase FAD binding subunit
MSDATLEELRAATGRPDEWDSIRALPQDHPYAPARYEAAPTSTEEAAAVLRAAAAHDLAVVVTGGLSKLNWGYPPRRVDVLLSTRRLTGVVEHAAGDLIAVVRAGTRLADLQARLAHAGQHLAIDAPLPAATVGGTVAVNASGPRRMAYGTTRDLLIGVTVVRTDGVISRSGGKVVKNVAGYDLGKLMTGSYGTLALITECVFRLHPLPESRAYVIRRVEDVPDAAELVAAVLGAQMVPSALEVDVPPDGDVEVAVLIEGTEAGVTRRAAGLARLLRNGARVRDVAPRWWAAYPWQTGATGLKLTAALSGVPGLLAAARAAGARHGAAVAVRGSAGTGVLYGGIPGDADPDAVARIVDDLRAAAQDAGGHAVVLTAPAAVREHVDMWGPVPGLDLMRRVKEQFDPDGRLAPGRFTGGI